MADFSKPAPVETAKSGAYLHEREGIPAPPDQTRKELLVSFVPMIVGVLFALGIVALGFEARASWTTHRDWVIPVTIPMLVPGGIAFGYLVSRARMNALAPAAVSFAFAVLFALLNVWRGSHVDGEDGLRDTLSILTAVCLALGVASLVISLVVVEAKDPTKAPAPQM